MEYLIPKGKSDNETIDNLKQASSDQIRPIIADLMEWLQDGNWPIASDIVEVLKPFDQELVPHIRYILNTDDGDWKYYLLTDLVRTLPNQVINELRIERIKNTPKADEIESGLDEIIIELLARI